MEGNGETNVSNVSASGVENGTTISKQDQDDDVIIHRVVRIRENEEEEVEVVNEEDFMKEMDVVDAWEGDEDKLKEDLGRKNRSRDRERRPTSRKKMKTRRAYRERRRIERRAESRERERLRREERKREPSRRDPTKSNKDIERDKIRAKKDSETRLLAEKERALKHILDSDEVVPPGTEEDAIESIVEMQAQEENNQRRRSLERYKFSPCRRRRVSPYRRRSPFRRSPIVLSPDRRRSPFHRRSPIVLSPDRRRSPDRRKKASWDHRTSVERRWSIERQKRRLERERDLKLSNRRSRSRDRHRSPSNERRKRYSRSPRRRSHSRSRSPDRRRKRSPFINEIARQLRNEMEVASSLNRYSAPAPVNVPPFQPDSQARPPLSNPNFVPQGPPVMQGPPIMPGPVAPPGVSPINAPSGIPGQGGAPRIPGPSFMTFEPRPPALMMNFDQMSAQVHPPDFASVQPTFGQANPPLGPGPLPVPVPMHTQGPMPGPPMMGPPGLPLPVLSPQPVPAPGPSEYSSVYNPSHLPVSQLSPSHKSMQASRNMNHPSQSSSYDRRAPSPRNVHEMSLDDRLKTPEPPVISDPKHFEKTSLSSLLEASVSKDSKNTPVLYPGFRPEILRHCEYALRDLPSEDPRLKMKGRFFFNPNKKLTQNESAEEASNSILLRKGKNKIDWEDFEEPAPVLKTPVQMHQKICQTDEVETTSMGVQTIINSAHIGTQVYPADLQQSLVQQDKRPVSDRLDWNVRETYDYSNKIRETDDLRWSLSSSHQKRPWGRSISPDRSLRPLNENNVGLNAALGSNLNMGPLMEHPRGLNLDPPPRERDPFPINRGSTLDHMRPGNFTNFGRPFEQRGNFHEERGNFHEDRGNFRDERGEIFCGEMGDEIRGESPMVPEEPPEDLDLDQGGFSRDPMGSSKASLFFKPRTSRDAAMGGRSFGRGNFRGKFW